MGYALRKSRCTGGQTGGRDRDVASGRETRYFTRRQGTSHWRSEQEHFQAPNIRFSRPPSPPREPCMKSPRKRAAEGLQIEDRFTIVRCFSDEDIRADFSRLQSGSLRHRLRRVTRVQGAHYQRPSHSQSRHRSGWANWLAGYRDEFRVQTSCLRGKPDHLPQAHL